MNLLAKLFVKGHAALYRLSNGKFGDQMGNASILLLHTVGAKSGKARVSPLVYFKEEGYYVLIASNGGAPNHPGWYHNLRASPETIVQIGDTTINVSAEVAVPAERQRLWDKIVPDNPQFDGYQNKTDRQIPVVLLKPVSNGKGTH